MSDHAARSTQPAAHALHHRRHRRRTASNLAPYQPLAQPTVLATPYGPSPAISFLQPDPASPPVAFCSRHGAEQLARSAAFVNHRADHLGGENAGGEHDVFVERNRGHRRASRSGRSGRARRLPRFHPHSPHLLRPQRPHRRQRPRLPPHRPRRNPASGSPIRNPPIRNPKFTAAASTSAPKARAWKRPARSPSITWPEPTWWA